MRQWLTVDASVAVHTVGVRRAVSSVPEWREPWGSPWMDPRILGEWKVWS